MKMNILGVRMCPYMYIIFHAIEDILRQITQKIEV